MTITYNKARGYLGKTVVANCRKNGRHIGVLRKVTRDGIYMERTGPQYVAADDLQADLETADRGGRAEGQEVFFPLLFLPFLTLFALAPWYGYGYGAGYRYRGYRGYGGYGYRGRYGYPGYFW